MSQRSQRTNRQASDTLFFYAVPLKTIVVLASASGIILMTVVVFVIDIQKSYKINDHLWGGESTTFWMGFYVVSVE